MRRKPTQEQITATRIQQTPTTQIRGQIPNKTTLEIGSMEQPPPPPSKEPNQIDNQNLQETYVTRTTGKRVSFSSTNTTRIYNKNASITSRNRRIPPPPPPPRSTHWNNVRECERNNKRKRRKHIIRCRNIPSGHNNPNRNQTNSPKNNRIQPMDP